jgi:ATP-dependent helicase/DNAse subunit B
LVTLTGSTEDSRDRRVFQRFRKTCERLEKILENVKPEPLPEQFSQSSPGLSHLEAGLFDEAAEQLEADGSVELIQAPNRAGEAREALRWLKERLVRDRMGLAEVALLARNMAAYRPFVLQAAQEFGLPIRLLEGQPLRESPVVVALLDLMRLALPEGIGDGPALPRKVVAAAWRSPYFDWGNAYESESAAEAPEAGPIGITPSDADALDAVARWGRVIGGLSQWDHVFTALAGRESRQRRDEEQALPANVAIGQDALALQEKFRRFLMCIYPPQGRHRTKEYVRWLEDLIGGDPLMAGGKADPTSLRVAERIYEDKTPLAGLEIAALNGLKEVLRGLIWIEEQTGDDESITFSRFYAELTGSIDVATFEPPIIPDREEILVAQVLRARGLPFRAVALLGMAEGEFPATLSEDLFLPEVDRDRLREEYNLALEPSIESAEREFFYEAITAPTERLLLTRPDLADSGAEWPPSPFWEEIQRLLRVAPNKLKTDTLTAPQRAASRAELMESLAGQRAYTEARAWVQAAEPERWRRLVRAGRIFTYRFRAAATAYDGDLVELGDAFAGHFRVEYRWSPSSLENYLGCPYRFFVSKVLALEPRVEPVEGLDARQLGSIYHEILEALYDSLPAAERSDPQKLLNALPGVARPILDRAPGRQGFRETAWWRETRHEIEQNVTRSVQALASMTDGFEPIRFEAGFFKEESLEVSDGDDSFRLHGVVDRVDRDANGRIRVIDYKTAGPYGYGKRALEQGEKLQLPLYALAARDALDLGEPVDGFYWHIRQAEASGLKLAEYGAQEAIETALEYAWRAVGGARQGQFGPTPPSGGCPAYCPAVEFCWRYRGRR